MGRFCNISYENKEAQLSASYCASFRSTLRIYAGG